MTYQALDTSTDRGQPIELLEIQYAPGDDHVIRTTSGDRDVTVGGHLYTAFATNRDAFDDEGNPDDAKQLSIRVPRDHPFIKKFDEQEFPNMVAIRIKRCHLDDPDLGTYNMWSGRMVGLAYEHPWMVIGGEKIATSLSRTGCRIRYMRQCPHTLYMPRCWVDKEAHKAEVKVWDVDSSKTQVRFSTLPGGPTDFVGGILKFGELTRFIIKQEVYGLQNQRLLTLSRPLLDLTSMASVTLYPGCDRLAATCDTKFHNLLNYGGFDYIPPKGPFQGTSIV
ncbi:DUF2163 domain-containing protein [Aeromonas phage pAEv1812]|nr:DUF2163 domain-containing protein [Aeromonas phage pAEv1812]